MHIEMPPIWQNEPMPQSAFDVHWLGRGMTTGAHCWPAGQLEHWTEQRPAWHVANAGQSASDWHGGTQVAVLLPGRTLQTSGDWQVTLAHEGGGCGEPELDPDPDPEPELELEPAPELEPELELEPVDASFGWTTLPQCPSDWS